MGVRITDKNMTSDITRHSANLDQDANPDGPEVWRVTWLPSRALKRNQVTTAMVLAERVARRMGDHTDKDWLFIDGWAEELGLSGPTAVSKISYTEHDLR